MTGGAWLSSARVVRCWVKSRNERNPYPVFEFLTGDCFGNEEKGEDNVKSSCPLCLGLHTWYNGQYNGLLNRKVELILKNWSQFGLEAETRLHEAGIASKRGSAIPR